MRSAVAVGGVVAWLALPAFASADHAGPLGGEWHLDGAGICCINQDFTYGFTTDSSGHDLTVQTANGGGGSLETGPGGKFGSALTPNSTAHLSRPQTDLLQPQRLTVMAWVKNSGYPGSLRYIVGQGDDGNTCAGPSYALYSGVSSDYGLSFFVRTTGGFAFAPKAGSALWDGQWHMVAGTFDGARVRLYIDGTQVGADVASPAGAPIDYTLSGSRFFIDGYPPVCPGISTFPGGIDEVRVYDRALSATEIGRLAAAPGPDPPVLEADKPIVHTTGADQVTISAARISGTIDDLGIARPYFVEYGTSTAYGQRTADVTTSGAGSQEVQALLGGLSADTDYHARLVSDGAAGEDVTFHTAAPDLSGFGLPQPLDFTWSPRADVQVAGAPAGGLRFQATTGPGVAYAWDFDFHDGQGFRPDPGAGDATPRRGFSADGAHDTDRASGADGERRRVYTVRLHATAPNGSVGDVSHDIVVMPNAPPKVDFFFEQTTPGATRQGTTWVNAPVSFRPVVTDPDVGPRVADAVDHIEWDFDTPVGLAAGDPAGTDLICDADGTHCRLPDGSGAPGPWFGEGPGGAAIVNFWGRALAGHGLRPLSAIDLDTLPTALADGSPLKGGLAVRNWTTGIFYTLHDPRVSYLYDNATLLMQSSFNRDAGEATGAQLKPGASTRAGGATAVKLLADYRRVFATRYLTHRLVTLSAVDSAGARSSVSHTLPLLPDAPPKLVARFVNRSPSGTTTPYFRPFDAPKRIKAGRRAHKATTTEELDHPLTTQDELQFDARSTVDTEGAISWYTLEVGHPFKEPGTCKAAPPTQLQTSPYISIDGPPDGYGPGQFFPGVKAGGTGPRGPLGLVGSLPTITITKGLQKARFRGAETLPTLGQLLAGRPYKHPCVAFSARNVVPESFVAVGGAATRPVSRYTPIASELLKPFKDLVVETTAVVTKNPDALRFRIPRPGIYSVSVGAYDESGQGAIQRTDGFEIKTPNGKCTNISGEPLSFAGKVLGFSGLCMDFGGNRDRFWTSGEMDVNGVVLRPDPGVSLYVNNRCGKPPNDTACRLLATTVAKPDNLATVSESALQAKPGGVAVVVDGDVIARFSKLTLSRARDWIAGRDHSAQPAIPADARYKGSPVARPASGAVDYNAFHTDFGDRNGQTATEFSIILPREFSTDGQDNSGPDARIKRGGIDEPRSTILSTNKFADIARVRKSAEARRRARAAAINLAGTINLSGTSLGPVSIVKGQISFDASSASFKATIDDAWLNFPPKPSPAKFHLTIANGKLEEAGGEVGVTIPLFAGVNLTAVRFAIVTDPLTLSGGASFSAIEVLNGDLDFIVRPKPFFLRLEGRVRVSELELGNAFVQYDSAKAKTLTFGGHFGYDFGPASVSADLAGGISFDTGDFYIQGGGRGCMFYCLGVQALVSNIALAACGTVDLVLVDISVGFAYRFGDGVKLFTGCDLEPYKPAIFKTRAGPRADAGRGGTVSVAAGTEQASFRFQGGAAATRAPKVTLTAPDGRVFTTAASPGDYVFAPPGPASLGGAGGATTNASALIDQDPVDHVTTFLVAKPPAGDWQVALDPGDPPLASAEYATGEHLDASAIKGDVEKVSLGNGSVEIGKQEIAVAAAHASAGKFNAPAIKALRRLPDIEDKRLRGIVLTVPKGLTGKLTLLDASANGTGVITTLDLAKSGKIPVAFDPTGDPGKHQLQGFITHSDGIPRKAVLLDTFDGPAVAAPSAPDVTLTRNGDGDTFVTVDPGSAGGLANPATMFELLVTTSAGRRVERLVDSRDATSLGDGRFRVALGEFGRSETLVASGRMLYGNTPGKSTTDTLRRNARRS